MVRKKAEKVCMKDGVKCECNDESVKLIKESQSSVEIKKDAKGNVSFTVKVYSSNIEEAKDLALKNYLKLNGELRSD